MRTAYLLIAALLATPVAARELPGGLVYLRDIDASIAQDMRYAGTNNFTGHPVPGYDAPECVLKREAALALRQVQADLKRQQLSLKVYDCYRPTRAVAAFMRWARAPDDGATKRFYPALEKRALFAQGYIAAASAHSTGIAVDLTLIPLAASPAFRSRDSAENRNGPCTAPVAQRAPDNSLDMGTGFDCFDPKSHTMSGDITPEQKRARGLLLAAMRAHGFHNYFREWWHFTFGGQRPPALDVPIGAR